MIMKQLKQQNSEAIESWGRIGAIRWNWSARNQIAGGGIGVENEVVVVVVSEKPDSFINIRLIPFHPLWGYP